MTSVPIFRISFTSAEKEGIGSQKYTRIQAHIKEIRRKQNKFDSTVAVIKKKDNAYE